MNALRNAQLSYDAQTPDESYDPTEDMDDAEYGAALVRWMQRGGPDGSRFGMEQEVRAALIAFLIAEEAS